MSIDLNFWKYKEGDMNSFMDILIDFGCPLYDPQISTSFIHGKTGDNFSFGA